MEHLKKMLCRPVSFSQDVRLCLQGKQLVTNTKVSKDIVARQADPFSNILSRMPHAQYIGYLHSASQQNSSLHAGPLCKEILPAAPALCICISKFLEGRTVRKCRLRHRHRHLAAPHAASGPPPRIGHRCAASQCWTAPRTLCTRVVSQQHSSWYWICCLATICMQSKL